MFDHVFAQCVARGLVAGERQAVDSAPVKANASLDCLCEKQPAESRAPPLTTASQENGAPVVIAPAHHLRREAARQAKRRTEPDPWGRNTKKPAC